VRPILRWFPGRARRRARQIATASIVAAAALAAWHEPARADTLEAIQNEIRASLERWQSAFNDRDEQRVCDLFARDVVANYEGEPERDYASLCQLLQNAVQDRERVFHYSYEISEILVYGEAAVVRLVWKLEVDQPGAAKEIIKEPAVDIFRRQADGNWKISRYFAYPSSP
jgi:uncharacterized protein (TIGR02246 family)